MDYSGYDRESWEKRTDKEHRNYGYKELQAKTKAEKKDLEHKYGARYSILFELPYYDSVRFVTIDVMHNLFLGTSKHVMSIWKDLEIITNTSFEVIQKRIQSLKI